MPEDKQSIGDIAETVGLFPAAALDAMMAPSSSDLWFVVEQDGAVVGFAFCQPEALADGVWNLRAIGVAPAAQRGGFGSMLLAAVEAALRERLARLLIIETSDAADQAAAREFYVAHGCSSEAAIRDFWGVGVAKLVYSKRINGQADQV